MSWPSPSSLRAFFGRYVIALVVAILLTGTAVASVDREINQRVADIKKIPLVTAAVPPGGANYLIIGSDTREFVNTEIDEEAFGGQDGGKNSDTLMVAHVEPNAQRTLVVSFPRDLKVYVPSLGRETKINAAYGVGGPQGVIEMLDYNFHIPINHYVEVNFESFRQLVNAVGNVPTYFPYATRDEFTGLSIPFGGGCYPLDGDYALAYARARHLEYKIDGEWEVTGQDAPDLYRIARQQEFIRRLAGVGISRSLGDPFVAVSVADNVLGYVTVDEGTGRDQINELIRAFRTVDVDSDSVQFETVPVVANSDGSTLSLGSDADAVIDRLRTFDGDVARTPKVLPGQVKVRVLDGNGKGEAKATVDQLVQLGFVGAGTGTASKPADISEIRYGPTDLEAAKLLLTYFPDARLVLDPGLSGRTVVVLGSSFAAITVPTTTTTVAPAAPVAPEETAPAATTLPRDVTTTTLVDPAAAACR
jgi:LCP family protein required for cell wall assembly